MGQVYHASVMEGKTMMGSTNPAMMGLAHTIGVLQQLQRLLPVDARLLDVDELLACVEAEHGDDALLENVIQALVGEHLSMQIEQREARRTRLEVVA